MTVVGAVLPPYRCGDRAAAHCRLFDEDPQTMTRLDPLAARGGAAIRYMPVLVPVEINAAVRATQGESRHEPT